MQTFTTHGYTLTHEQVADVLSSAFEGGSNSWYLITEKIKPPVWTFESEPCLDGFHWACDYPLNPGGALLIESMIDPQLGVRWLDLASIEKGLDTMATEYSHHFHDVVSENADAITGDVFLQCCLFGEVIYG